MYNCKKKIQVKIWWNTRLGLFVIEDIAYSHSVNAFVGIPKLKTKRGCLQVAVSYLRCGFKSLWIEISIFTKPSLYSVGEESKIGIFFTFSSKCVERFKGTE